MTDNPAPQQTQGSASSSSPESLRGGPISQTDAVLSWLKGGASLNPMEALEYMNCFRLGARIHNLREAGYRIETKMVYRGRRHWAEYSLAKDETPPHIL